MLASAIVGLAEPAELRVGAPDSAVIEHARLTLRVERSGLRGAIAFDLRNRSARWTGDAHVQYRATVGSSADPALVELIDETRAHEQLAIHVFPVAARSPAHVELAIELPAGQAIAIEPVGHTIAHLDVDIGGQHQRFEHVDEARTIELPAPADTDTPPAPFAVDAHHALLAEPPLPAPTFDLPVVDARITSSLTAKEIRTKVRLAEPRLQHCYTLEAQKDPSLAGTLELRMRIAPDGQVELDLAGTLDNAAVRACIARDVSTWRFRATESAVQANYPLEFRLHE